MKKKKSIRELAINSMAKQKLPKKYKEEVPEGEEEQTHKKFDW